LKNLIVFAIIILFSCNSEKHQISKYYSDNERDSLLTNIITYVYTKAPGATDSTKWESKYRSYYVKNLPSFHIENYFIAENGWHYFFMIRPVGSSEKRRGVLGKFKLDKGNLKPIEFEEIVNTPHLDEEIVKERGAFLFKKLIEKGNLNEYLAMKQYIEWPDATLFYDKKTNNWVKP
jgi:hypothetical protein